MRVALISSSSGSRGGGELYLCYLAEGLRKFGVEVVSVVNEHPRMEELAGRLGEYGEVRRLPFRNLYDRRLRNVEAIWAGSEIKRSAQALASLDVDLYHLNRQNLEDAPDLLLALRRIPKPAVCTVHVTRTAVELGARLGGLRDWVARRTIVSGEIPHIVISESCRTQFQAFISGGHPKSRPDVVINGVPLPPPVSTARTIRPEIVIGTVARLELQKDPMFLLDLFSRLPDRARLQWIGDGSLREPFQRRAVELGIADRVEVTGWCWNARERLDQLDVFVLPSRYEGLPLSILEAMAAGLPVVASDADGNREAVVNGVTGWVCDNRDAESWIRPLTALCNDVESRRKMGHAARLRFEDQFTAERMARDTLAVYQKILDNTRRLSANGHHRFRSEKELA